MSYPASPMPNPGAYATPQSPSHVHPHHPPQVPFHTDPTASTATPPPPPPKPSTSAPSPYPQSPAGTVAPPVPPPPRPSSYAAQSQDHQSRGQWAEQETLGTRQAVGHAGMPALPPEGWVPDVLREMHKNDLHHLLQTPALQASLLRDPAHAHASLKASGEALAAQLAHTQALAAQVAQTEGHMEQMRERVGRRLLAVRAQEQSWRKKQADMEGRLEEYGPRVLHGRLGRAIVDGEEEARVLEETWIDVGGGEGKATERETAEWVRRLREQRKIVWLRRERRGRWDEGRVGGWR